MRQSFYDFCNDNKRLDLLMQWDIDANLPLTPKSITSGSSRNIWWRCEKGHEWQAAVASHEEWYADAGNGFSVQ